jgi:cytochrome P450
MRTLPPGPKNGVFGLTSARRLDRERLDFPLELARTYGDIVSFRLGPVRAFLLNHPDFVREVLVTRAKSFGKLPRVINGLRSVDGNGLVLSEGDFWLRQRRLVQPAFSVKRFDGYARSVVRCTENLADSWRSGTQIDATVEMRKLALAIIAKTLFDFDVAEEAVRIGIAVETISEIFTRQAGAMIQWPEWVPTRDNRRKREAVGVLDRVIRRVIRERRASGEDKGDLLSMLLAAVDDEGNGQGMTDEQARDEAMTLFNAGHDTTAAGLTWLWYLVATHRNVEEALRDEAHAVLGGRPATYGDLARLKYTTTVVKESLRIYPPTWSLIPRVALEDVPVGQYVLPKGGWIYIYPWVLHRDPRFFPEPERFDPERFGPGRVEKIPQHAYIPFGAGPHVCIGNTFATMELVLAVSTLVQRYRFAFPTEHPPVVPEAYIAIRPRHGLRIDLEDAPSSAFAT